MSERIQKRLAAMGLASRREIERMIEQGLVKVNGELAKIGQPVSDDDVVMFDGKKINLSTDATPSKHLIIYNKPEGEICTRKDTHGRPTVFDNLPSVRNGRWISIGRLDINTSGLLLFTTDGELANRLMHPSYTIDREYAVRVLGDVTDDMIKTLITGVELEDGPARFEDVVAPKYDEDNTKANQWFYVCIQEGRNREVRRIWEALPDIKVSRLKRVRYANVFLDKNLKQGQWRLAEQEELDELYKQVEMTAPVLKTEKEDKGQRKEKFTRAKVNQQRSSKPKSSTQARSDRGAKSKANQKANQRKSSQRTEQKTTQKKPIKTSSSRRRKYT